MIFDKTTGLPLIKFPVHFDTYVSTIHFQDFIERPT